MLSDLYRRQAALLVRLLPLVAEEPCFALKGGTAINFFVRDMPRLSVDIDLMYLPVQDRPSSLAEIESALTRIGERVVNGIPGARLQEVRTRGEGTLTRIDVRTRREQVKVEVSPVLRGCVFDPEIRSVSPMVERQFGFAEMQVASFPDLYAGKIIVGFWFRWKQGSPNGPRWPARRSRISPRFSGASGTSQLLRGSGVAKWPMHLLRH